MARIRSIKPEFWSSEQITECSMNARLMFIGMWNFSDDAGRKVASTKRLKMEVFPGDAIRDSDIRKWMDELVLHGLVLEYESQGQRYWQVTGWKHQKIQHPQESTIPDPFNECSMNVPVPFTPELKGIELNREEEKKIARKRAVPYSSDFEQWWSTYPKKVGKDAAAKAYQQALKRIDATALLEVTVAFASTPKALGEFCWNPATWLNQGHWTDDPSEWQESRGAGTNGEQSYAEYQAERQKRLAKTRALLDGKA